MNKLKLKFPATSLLFMPRVHVRTKQTMEHHTDPQIFRLKSPHLRCGRMKTVLPQASLVLASPLNNLCALGDVSHSTEP